MSRDPFTELADDLQYLATTVVKRANLSAPDLGRVLGFVAKVSHVVEQAFQDVLPILIDIKYLIPEDIHLRRIRDLQKEVELLTVRSRYRDVEEICSRLHHLSDQYRTQIAPLVAGIPEADSWRGVFRLID